MSKSKKPKKIDLSHLVIRVYVISSAGDSKKTNLNAEPYRNYWQKFLTLKFKNKGKKVLAILGFLVF